MVSFYDSFDYPSYWSGREYENECEKIALLTFLKKIGKKSSLVDIGGGFGRLTSVYSTFFEKCLIVDPSEELLKIAKKNLKGPKFSFQKGTLPNLSLPDNSFDVVLVIRLVHHLEDPFPSIKEINRILKANGFLILEMANKIHFLAVAKAFFSGNFSFIKDFSPLERRCPQSIAEGKITFLNHHPQKMIIDLKKAGFSVLQILSVSNFRYHLVKKIFPLKFLVFWEKIFQKPLAKFFFGPSIFFLAKK